MRLAAIRSLLGALVLALLVTPLAPLSASAKTWPVPTTRTEETAQTLNGYERQLIVEINEARLAHGVRRIKRFSSCADRLAERWGRRLARTGEFYHRDQRVVLRRCKAAWAGENLVRGHELAPEDMVELWLDSPGHRKILLSRRARQAGVAVKRDGEGRLIGVLNVIRRR